MHRRVKPTRVVSSPSIRFDCAICTARGEARKLILRPVCSPSMSSRTPWKVSACRCGTWAWSQTAPGAYPRHYIQHFCFCTARVDSHCPPLCAIQSHVWCEARIQVSSTHSVGTGLGDSGAVRPCFSHSSLCATMGRPRAARGLHAWRSASHGRLNSGSRPQNTVQSCATSRRSASLERPIVE